MTTANGTVRKMRMPVRSVVIDLDGDYEGFRVTMRSNPPIRVFTAMQGEFDFERLRDIVSALILEWNLADEVGEPIPVGKVDELSVELFGRLIELYMQNVLAVAAVPKASDDPSLSGLRTSS